MTNMTLPSDMIIRPLCISIGIISLLLNTFTLFLIVKLRRIYTSNIFVVFVTLQIFYLVQNAHFTILFIPFLYSTLGGGYCIGLLCEPHYTPFYLNYTVWIFLVVLLSGFFVLLLFYRHQNLLPDTSPFKLRRRTSKIFSISLLMYMSIPAFRYASIAPNQDDQRSEILLIQLCPDCRFIQEKRNFGVISREDSVISGILILFITGSCALFAFFCGGHIMHLMSKYRNHVNVRTSINLRQTSLSLIQIIVFGTFLAVPIGLTVSMLWIGPHDNILVSVLLLLSVNSFVNSSMVLLGTPPFRRYIRHFIRKYGTKSSTVEVSSRVGTSSAYYTR